jgi:hypothetical protein
MIVGKAPEDWNVKPGDVVGEEEVILIDVPDGWTAHKEGIVICREDWHWCDQDMWWAQGPDGWWLDVGTYSPEHKKYVCLLLRQKPFCEHVHFDESDERGADEVFPDWQNPDERVELDTADEVVAWICGWFEKLSAKSA